jgi:hypothetical protein
MFLGTVQMDRQCAVPKGNAHVDFFSPYRARADPITELCSGAFQPAIFVLGMHV